MLTLLCWLFLPDPPNHSGHIVLTASFSPSHWSYRAAAGDYRNYSSPCQRQVWGEGMGLVESGGGFGEGDNLVR